MEREQFSQYYLVNFTFNNKSKTNTFMQLNRQLVSDQKYRQVLTAPDPDQYLMQRYSSAIQTDSQQLQVCRMYLDHLGLKEKITRLEQQIEQMKDKIRVNPIIPATPKKQSRDLQKSFRQQDYSQQSNQNTNRNKRVRRTANQISRHFQCPVQTCRKQYGSQGSLNQHIKLKHQFLVRVYDSWAVSERGDIKYQE